jgi:tRNA 2-thiouridine synthesizing protein A
MSEEIKSDVKLDLKNLMCPLPVVKLSQAIKKIGVGQVIEAEATDPGVLADIPAWTKSTGNEMLRMAKDGKVIRFWVKRQK